jgi:hypothetical protein
MSDTQNIKEAAIAAPTKPKNTFEKVDLKVKVFKIHNSPILTKAIITDGVVRVGSHGNGNGGVAIPLTLEEQAFIMPSIVGFEFEDKQFKTEVEKYFADLTLTIQDTDYVTLDASYTKVYNADKELIKFECTKVLDYLMYKQVMTHPKVCSDKKKEPLKFQKNVIAEVIHEALEAQKIKSNFNNKAVAYAAIGKFVSDFENNGNLTEYVIDELRKTNVVLAVKTLNVNAPADEILDAIQKDCEKHPELVSSVLNRDNIELLSTIAFAIKTNVIIRVHDSYSFNDEFLGKDEQEIVAFMLKPENSVVVNQIKNKLTLQ